MSDICDCSLSYLVSGFSAFCGLKAEQQCTLEHNEVEQVVYKDLE